MSLDSVLSPGDTQELAPQEGSQEWYLSVRNSTVYLGRSTREAEQGRRQVAPGDRGKLRVPKGERVMAHAPSSNTKDARISADPAGFWFDPNPRAVLGTVTVNDDADGAPPSTDAYEWRSGSAVDVNASTVTEQIEMPSRADSVTIHVDDATGGYEVYVRWTDPEFAAITERGPSDNSNYDGSGGSEVFVTTSAASAYCEVAIVDVSGAANTVDYTVYAT